MPSDPTPASIGAKAEKNACFSSTPFGAPVLLPFTLAAVPTVDLTQGRLIADPPEGLF